MATANCAVGVSTSSIIAQCSMPGGAQIHTETLTTHAPLPGLNVRSGSFSDLGATKQDVRFAPLNRHRQLEGLRPISAADV
jgi:hypothetical protein